MARTLRLTLAIVGALSWACATTPAHSQQSPTPAVRFVIPAGSLDRALQALATQSRVQLMYSPDVVAQRRSPGLQASLSADEALAVLLRDTGLRAVQVTSNAFLIEAAPAIVAPPPEA